MKVNLLELLGVRRAEGVHPPGFKVAANRAQGRRRSECRPVDCRKLWRLFGWYPCHHFRRGQTLDDNHQPNLGGACSSNHHRR